MTRNQLGKITDFQEYYNILQDFDPFFCESIFIFPDF